MDYVAIGPVFATRTKADPGPPWWASRACGPRGRARACPWWRSAASPRTTPRAVVEAGADGVAVISAILAGGDVEAAVRRLRAAIGDTG